MRKLLLVLSISLLTAGCGIIYKQPIYQGNLLEKTAVDQLQTGMSKQQVQVLIGTPSIEDPFHQTRPDDRCAGGERLPRFLRLGWDIPDRQRRRRFSRAFQRLVVPRQRFDLRRVNSPLLAVKRLFAGVMGLFLAMEIDLRLEISQHLLDGKLCRHVILQRHDLSILRVI